MSYQPGSQIDLGLGECRRLDRKWIAEGRAAAESGQYHTLWNSVQQAAYHQRLAELQPVFSAKVPADWPTQEEIDIIVGGNYGYA